MDLVNLSHSALHGLTTPARSTRRKPNGAATAALLIQLASEFLDTSPTLRKRLGVSLTDLAAAQKVRRDLLRKVVPM